MSEQLCTTGYRYDELPEEAKPTAREERYGDGPEYEWWDFIYEDFTRIADLFGIEIALGDRKQPKIFFTGFNSQGDGASFEGTWESKPSVLKAVATYAPLDEELHRIARILDEEVGLEPIDAEFPIMAEVKQQGRAVHSQTMFIDSYDEPQVIDMEVIEQCFRDLADWLYLQLEKEFEYKGSKEYLEESIECNDVWFTGDGCIAPHYLTACKEETNV